jgi:hypothetical protein
VELTEISAALVERSGRQTARGYGAGRPFDKGWAQRRRHSLPTWGCPFKRYQNPTHRWQQARRARQSLWQSVVIRSGAPCGFPGSLYCCCAGSRAVLAVPHRIVPLAPSLLTVLDSAALHTPYGRHYALARHGAMSRGLHRQGV